MDSTRSSHNVPEFNSEDPITLVDNKLSQQKFTTEADLKRSLRKLQGLLLEGRHYDQYVVCTDVPPEIHSRLTDDASQLIKFCRFTYNITTRILISKIMPSRAHHVAIREFDYLIISELHRLNVKDEVWATGSATEEIGNWRKEADCSWATSGKPITLRFVVDVGFPESANQLALDAHGWLETETSPVNLALTITIHRETPDICFNLWELVPREHSAQTGSPPLQARRTASLKLCRVNGLTTVTGESCRNSITTASTHLELPFDKIVGRSPNQPQERNLMISEQDLREFVEWIWTIQNLI
ncbi:unnamed protein product [Penicillium bialowiezense]